MELHLSQLPQAIRRLVEDFPQLEVILNNLKDTPTGDMLEIVNLHDQKIDVLERKTDLLKATSTSMNNRLTEVENQADQTQTELNALKDTVSKLPTGITVDGLKLNGDFALKAGANIMLYVNEVTKTITISASGTNAADGVPVGTIAFFAAMTPPPGWMELAGQQLRQDEYPELFAVIGTTFGVGDEEGTFLLPDLRGEFIRGWDHDRGVDPGRGFGTWQADEFKSHTHIVTYEENDAAGGSGKDQAWAWDSVSGTVQGYPQRQTSATGGPETRPRNIALLPCIRVKPVEKTLTEAVAELEGRLDTIEPQVNNNTVQIACIKSKLSAIDEQITATQTVIENLQSTDAQILDQLALIQQSINNLKSDIDQIKEVISMAYVTQEELDAALNRIQNLESNVATLQSSLDNLNNRLNALNTLAANLETSLADLSSSVDGLSASISNLDASVTQLNAAQDELEQAQQSLQSAQEAIQHRLMADKAVTPTSMISSVTTFQVGVHTEFEITTYANQNEGEMVRVYFTKPDEVSVLEYLEVRDGNWYPLTGNVFGPSTGFPLGDVTAKFRATIDAPGEYEMPFEYRRVSDDAVIAKLTLKFKAE